MARNLLLRIQCTAICGERWRVYRGWGGGWSEGCYCCTNPELRDFRDLREGGQRAGFLGGVMGGMHVVSNADQMTLCCGEAMPKRAPEFVPKGHHHARPTRTDRICCLCNGEHGFSLRIQDCSCRYRPLVNKFPFSWEHSPKSYRLMLKPANQHSYQSGPFQRSLDKCSETLISWPPCCSS